MSIHSLAFFTAGVLRADDVDVLDTIAPGDRQAGYGRQGWGLFLATSGDFSWPSVGTFHWPWTSEVLWRAAGGALEADEIVSPITGLTKRGSTSISSAPALRSL